MIKDENYILSNGVAIPKIGLGTWQSPNGKSCYDACMWALKNGYRSIDTAEVYGNEESVGKAIKDSKIKREELFITSKLPSHIKTYQGALDHFYETLKRLDLEYLDLYLIHAPWPWSEIGKDCTEGNIEAWKAFIEIYNKGLVRAIGVSNFKVENLEPVIKATGFVPHVNQIKYFISNTQKDVVEYCMKNNILIEAYSPLATGKILDNEVLKEVALRNNVSIPRLCIRYCIQKGVRPLPKSLHEEYIKQNIDVDFEISDKDMSYLDKLDNLVKK